jgi:hypothetical protein
VPRQKSAGARYVECPLDGGGNKHEPLKIAEVAGNNRVISVPD